MSASVSDSDTLQDFIVACRLFKGEPVWTPHNRSDIGEDYPARQQYVKARA